MRLVFLNPPALLLLGLAAVPFLVHLLVKRPGRRVLFPTVRLLSPGTSRAARLRQLSDWPLLGLRMLLVAVAALALARPLAITPARERLWQERIARVVLVDRSPSAEPALTSARAMARTEAEGAFAGRIVETRDLAMAIKGVSHLFSRFPPARRELVIVSDFQEDAIDPSALDALPREAGVRVLRSGAPVAAERPARGLPDVLAPEAAADAVGRALGAVAAANNLTLSKRDSRVVVGVRGVAEIEAMARRAQAPNAPWMAEVVRAIADAGLDAPGSPNVDCVMVDGRLLAIADVDPRSFDFPRLLDAVVRGLGSEHDAREALLPPSEPKRLASLERPAAGVAEESVRNADEDDARWLWVIVAALLAAEGWLRTRRLTRRITAGAGERAA